MALSLNPNDPNGLLKTNANPNFPAGGARSVLNQDPNVVVRYENGHPVNFAGDYLDGYKPNTTFNAGNVQGVSTINAPSVDNYDPAAAAAAAKAAADAAKSAQLRSGITNLVNNIKDIFNSRYGQVDASGAEQVGKLQTRFGQESNDIAQQVEGQNQAAGASYAGRGSFDSSYRGNTVDTIKHAGEAQVRDLGQELQDNLAKVGSWVSSQKQGFDAQKQGLDSVLSHLAEETNPDNLVSLRNQLDSRIAELRAGGADNNTSAQNIASLENIAPSSTRAQQLKTTLSTILGGGADAALKATIGERLITNSGLSPEEQQKLLQGFQGDLASQDKKQQTEQ
jgi:hypothetical protein